MTAVHVVVPDGIDDPASPSGGNSYDRRVCRGLTALGWTVSEHRVPGCWPHPDNAAGQALAAVVAGIPDAAVVLLDGLVASTLPEVLVPESARLRLVVLVHMPLGGGSGPAAGGAADREGAVLSAATAVVTTSAWTRRRLLDRYPLRPELVHVAEPGVDAADVVTGTPAGGRLLCVASVTPLKGYDVLLAALAGITDLRWHCECVGSLDRDPGFVRRLRRQTRARGMSDRVRLLGPQTGDGLDAAYAAADLLVLASRAETYGMVVTEALARGLPVVASAVGGLPETLGLGADGMRPGLLVRPDDPAGLAAALREWLCDGDLRERLRQAARERRPALSGWSVTTGRLADVLARAAT